VKGSRGLSQATCSVFVQGVLFLEINLGGTVKAKQQETSAVAVESPTKEGRSVLDAGEESFRSCQIIPVLNLLLDQNMHFKPPAIREFVYHGPVDALLQSMRERRGGPDGIPKDAADFVEWLRTPANAKRVRQAQILVSFPPFPRREGVQMIRVERAESADQYQKLVDGVRV
jgi:hypothetical protein